MNKENGFFVIIKSLLIISAMVAFLVFSYSMLFETRGMGHWYKSIRAEITNQPYARTITVSAEGKISSKPDIAYVDLSVQTAGATVSDVTGQNNIRMNSIIDGLKKSGVKDEDIRTVGYNLYPRYNNVFVNYDSDKSKEISEPKIVGYTLDQTVKVKVRDLSKVDQIMDESIKNGANQIGSLVFDIDEAGNLKKTAREKAFSVAREKAEEMSKAAGVKLGRVVTFSENDGVFYPKAYPNYAMDMMRTTVESIESASIQPGSQELNISVTVTYEID